MRNKIAFVAVGQAGGNLGKLFEEKGYSVLYINTSQEDLDTLTTAKYRYHITGGEGCNKDRKKAKQLIVDDFDNIIVQLESVLTAGMIFVLFASGGGTGSGAGPMLADLLLDEGKTIGIVTIIPDKMESIKSHINSYECFSELVEIEGTSSCFVLDNGREEKLKLNKVFAEAFCSFLEVPESCQNEKGNIDKAEVEETLKAHGMALVLSQKGQGSASAIEGLTDNVFAPMEADRAVKYITAACAGETAVEDLQKVIGIPVDTFQTFGSEETIFCISGLSYPQTRLEEVYKRVEENRETIAKNLAAARETNLRSGINFLNELEQKPMKQQEMPKRPKSKRDIMSKYLC